MKFSIRSGLLLIGIICTFSGKAQQPFTLQSAIDTALRNNFDIRIAKNNVEISRRSNTYGLAGGLPYVNASAGDNYSGSNSSQQLSDGTETELTNLNGNVVNAGVSAGMVLFNGFRVIATKERLNHLQNQSEVQLNQQIQQTIADVMISYYDIIRQQNYLRIIEHSLEVSNQKLAISNVRNQVGMADAVDLLQSQTDVNSAEQLLALQQMVVEQNKDDFLLLINAVKRFSFEVADTIVVDQSLQLDSIIGYLKRNPQYLSAELQVLIDGQLVKEVAAQRYPSLKLSAGYDFYQSDYNKGSVLMNRNYGPTAGIALQVPIFNGFVYKSQQDIAKIRVDNAVLKKESLVNSLETRAGNLFRVYSTTLKQIESQRKNYEMTQQLVDVVIQQFNLGQATILDVKAAQSSFENTAFLLVNLLFSAKVAEIELKQLIYSLAN
jgi:outer membrane protein TolC